MLYSPLCERDQTRFLAPVELGHELVESLVKSGRYQNAGEVLREGLRLLEREQAEEAAKVAVLRQAAEQGWSDLASGRFDEVDDESLDDFVGQLGVRAAKTQPTG